MRDEYDFSKARRGAALASPGKTRITIMLDDDVISFFRAQAEQQGTGYQTMVNAALRAAMAPAKAEKPDAKPVTAATLRRILREELRAG
ncbi:BrnA antitoxin family protein [Pseudorhodoferax soli]|uniref:BrnA antitoxin of type II toxin-antitoxin system n=1 Tax=Pseudorhodoferax soli TaxID=545864 RepID=A0A368X950_9BURK|nr:BrnA antitoxin family protein [Pseudorhodoferax soli]RCW64481.1 BrnA antitoxin of type II toxin-antitoxin system [Pseudorhodoferax soli]